MSGVSPKTDVLIITVNKVESLAVMDSFQQATGRNPYPITIDDRTYHDLGEVNGARIFLALSEMGASGLGASQQVIQKGISALCPSAVIAVGIAFGVDEQKQAIGDILVSQQLWLYDLQRIGKEIIPRGDKPHASAKLIDRFRNADLHWSGAKVYFGLILTGDKLVDNIDYRDELRKFEPEAIGGEMEGAGLYVACQDAHVDWILVKAICDWADGNKSQDKDIRQQLAARNAAQFVLHTLKLTLFRCDLSKSGLPTQPSIKLDNELDTSLESSGSEKPIGEIIDYSYYTKMVLNEITKEIKTSIGYYIPIHLKEMPSIYLKNSDSNKNKSVLAGQVWPNHDRLIVLGEPGSGKSCLLDQLAVEIITKSSSIPIIINAKFWGFRFNTIPQAIEYVLNSYKVNIDSETIRNELISSKYVILIDGYDEISNSKELFESEIISLAKSYTNKLILTSRTANYHGELPRFDRFEIDKLSDDQINEYAKHTISFGFFSSHLYKLKLLELARLPLYLFMLCNIAQDLKKLPKNKSILQDKFASYLLEDYLIKRIPGYQAKYPLQLKLQFLSKLAEKKTTNPLYDNYLQCSKELELIDDPYTLMKEILESGVLKGNYSSFEFIHPTVREFFYARQLLTFGSKELIDFLKNNHGKDEFLDIILFLAGLPKEQEKQREILDFLENNDLPLYVKSLKSRYTILENTNNFSKFENDYLSQLQRSYNSLLVRFFGHIKFRFFPYSVIPLSEIYLVKHLNVRVVGYINVPHMTITYGYNFTKACDKCEPLIVSKKTFSEKFDDGTPFYKSTSIRDLDLDLAREMALEDIKRELKDIIGGRWLMHPMEISCEEFVAYIKEISSKARMFCDKSLEPLWKFSKGIYDAKEYYEGFNNIKKCPYISIGTTPRWPFDAESILMQLKDLERDNISLKEYVLPSYFLGDQDPLLGENMEKRLVLRLTKMYSILPRLYLKIVESNFPELRKYMRYANICPFKCFVRYHYGIDLMKKGLIRCDLGEASVYFKPISEGEEQIACIEKGDPEISRVEREKLSIEYKNDLKSLGRYSNSDYFRIFTPSIGEIIDNLALTKALYELLIEDLEWFLDDR